MDPAPTGRQGPGEVNLGTTSGDPDEVTVSTTDPDKVTVWLGATGATDLTRPDAEELAALRCARCANSAGDLASRRGRTRPEPGRAPPVAATSTAARTGGLTATLTPLASSGFPSSWRVLTGA